MFARCFSVHSLCAFSTFPPTTVSKRLFALSRLHPHQLPKNTQTEQNRIRLSTVRVATAEWAAPPPLASVPQAPHARASSTARVRLIFRLPQDWLNLPTRLCWTDSVLSVLSNRGRKQERTTGPEGTTRKQSTDIKSRSLSCRFREQLSKLSSRAAPPPPL